MLSSFYLIVLFSLVAVLIGWFFWWLKKRSFRLRIFHSLDIRLLSLTFPYEFAEEKVEVKEELKKVSQFLSLLAERKKPFVFEVALSNIGKNIQFYLAVDKKEVEYFVKGMESIWPQIQVKYAKDYNVFNPHGSSLGGYLVLRKHFALPVKLADSFEADPLESILSSFAKLSETGEGMAYQLVLRKAGKNKNAAIRSIISKLKNGLSLSESLKKKNPFFSFLKDLFLALNSSGKNKEEKNVDKKIQAIPEDLLGGLNKKASLPLFEVDLRLVVSARERLRAESLLDQLASSFSQFNQPEANSFKLKKPSNLTKFFTNFSWRVFNKKERNILSSLEIAGLWHPPLSFLRTPEIKKVKVKEIAPPSDLPKEGLILGKNIFRGKETIIKMEKEDRRRHVYTIGQTGTGKSSFLFNLAKQDILEGEGLAVLDPHGDLINDLLSVVPRDRYGDVILFEPGSLAKPIGLNMLEYQPDKPEQKTFIVNELTEIFDQLYDLRQTGGPMFEQYMRNALLLLMDDPKEEATLVEVPKVFSDETYRHRLLEKCQNNLTYNFWVREAEKAGGEADLRNITPYITSKFNIFLSNDYVRPIIGQRKSAVNFREVMDKRKIFLINLSKGKLGEINSRLLGMIIVGKLFMAAMSRVDQPQEERKDFYLYMDEFQNFTTKTISQILSEARKYRLNLTIAHQFIGQLREDINKAVFGNVGTKVIFRVSAEDAERFAKEYDPLLKLVDFTQLDNFNAYLSLMIKGKPSLPFNLQTLIPEKGRPETSKEIRILSGLKYGRDREEVEREINERMRV